MNKATINSDDFVILEDGRQIFACIAVFSGGPRSLTAISFLVAASNKLEAQGKATFIAKDILKESSEFKEIMLAEVSNTQIVCDPGITKWKVT